MKHTVLTILLVSLPLLMGGCAVRTVTQEPVTYNERNVVHHYSDYTYVKVVEKDDHQRKEKIVKNEHEGKTDNAHKKQKHEETKRNDKSKKEEKRRDSEHD